MCNAIKLLHSSSTGGSLGLAERVVDLVQELAHLRPIGFGFAAQCAGSRTQLEAGPPSPGAPSGRRRMQEDANPRDYLLRTVAPERCAVRLMVFEVRLDLTPTTSLAFITLWHAFGWMAIPALVAETEPELHRDILRATQLLC